MSPLERFCTLEYIRSIHWVRYGIWGGGVMVLIDVGFVHHGHILSTIV